jgi:hypothetical protein
MTKIAGSGSTPKCHGSATLLITQKIVTKLSKILIWDPGSEIGIRKKNLFRIQGSKRHRIPDPDPQHCYFGLIKRLLLTNLFQLRIRIRPKNFSSLRIRIRNTASNALNFHMLLISYLLSVLRIRDVYPGSRIQKQQQKRGVKKNLLS